MPSIGGRIDSLLAVTRPQSNCRDYSTVTCCLPKAPGSAGASALWSGQVKRGPEEVQTAASIDVSLPPSGSSIRRLRRLIERKT